MTPGVYSYPLVLELTLAQPHLLWQKIPCLFSGLCESQSSIFQSTRFPLLLGGMRSLLSCLKPFCTVKSIYVYKLGCLGNNQSVGLSVPVVSRCLWPWNRTIFKVASMVVTWWIVAFLCSTCDQYLGIYIILGMSHSRMQAAWAIHNLTYFHSTRYPPLQGGQGQHWVVYPAAFYTLQAVGIEH